MRLKIPKIGVSLRRFPWYRADQIKNIIPPTVYGFVPPVRTVTVVRWIVDAMNVIGSRPDGWWKDRRRAMVRLIDQLDRWALIEGQQVTVVLEKPLAPPLESAVVVIGQAPRGGANSADDEIVRIVQADRRPQEITVVTSDVALTKRVRDLGAATHPAATFRRVIESG